MNARTRSRRRFLVASARAGAGMALLAALPGARSQSASSALGSPKISVIALAFDAHTQTLFTASAQAISRTSDGGQHWTPVEVPRQTEPARLSAIAVSAGTSGILYVAGKGVGVLRSDDGGQTWSSRNIGLPSADIAALTTHADRPDTVYAYLPSKGIFRSEDGGGKWRLMDAGPRGGIVGFIHSNMPGSMQSGWFFAAGPQGVRRAMDCFCGWRDAGELGRAVRAIAYDPHQPSDIYAATDAGLFFSGDGGEAWSKLEAEIPTVVALVVTPRSEIYAAGADGSLYVRDAAGVAWKRLDA